MSGTNAPAHRKSPHHERFLAAFLRSPRTVDVSREVGVSEATVRRWKARPENWSQVEARRDEFLESTIEALRQGLPQVAARLLKVALDELEPGVVVRAATAVFDVFAQLSTHTELEARLAALEQALLTRPISYMRPTLLTRPDAVPTAA